MSIIQQLAQIESRANTYNNQRTLHIYPKHPVAGATSPIYAFDVRIPYDNAADKSNALLLLELLKEKGICASLSFPDGNINNFKFLPREK
jgi:hypothetical protein